MNTLWPYPLHSVFSLPAPTPLPWVRLSQLWRIALKKSTVLSNEGRREDLWWPRGEKPSISTPLQSSFLFTLESHPWSVEYTQARSWDFTPHSHYFAKQLLFPSNCAFPEINTTIFENHDYHKRQLNNLTGTLSLPLSCINFRQASSWL